MEQLRSLNELRAALEPGAAASAAERGDAEGRAQLVTLADRMVRTGHAGDLETFLELDVAFHRRVLEVSGNEMFVGLTQVITEGLVGSSLYDIVLNLSHNEGMRSK